MDRRRVIRHQPYSSGAIGHLLGASKAAKYLATYLEELDAKSVIHEGHYVDRHFLEDFAEFYSRSYGAPSPFCERFHFFAELSDEALDELLERAYTTNPDERRAAEEKLNEKYLGFVVKRPLVGAEVGRTVLRTYPRKGARRFEVLRQYRVHVGGVRLNIEGLAYQQQDGGAAVCASTALWSALQQVAHMAGHRTPTPVAVTNASGSPFPASHGLDYLQMAAALTRLGYIADQFVPGANRAFFRAKLVGCLQSHLPVILMLTRRQAADGERRNAHAVTVTGFGEPNEAVEVKASRDHAAIRMTAGAVKTLYVHDDNLGSHAHYELWDAENDSVIHEGSEALMLHRGSSERKQPDWWQPDDWVVDCALVPKPSKLRMPIESLIGNALELKRILAEAAPDVSLDFATRFASGVEYKRSLFTRELDETKFRGFQETLGLPRFVGVISAFAENGAFHAWDALVDVTEVNRSLDPNVLGIVAPAIDANAPSGKLLKQLCERFKCPLITGPERIPATA